MKLKVIKLRLIALLLFSVFITTSEAQIVKLFKDVTPLSNRGGAFTISFDTTDNATITDLRTALSTYTTGGKTITISKVPLLLRTGQAYYINATNTDVQINYTNPLSLQNAVYTYLDTLGIHWYGAGENWLYKPTALNNVTMVGEWKEPTFRNRIFAGTGGLDYALSIDPNNNYKNNWYAWKRRIRMNTDFHDVGHSGDAFYKANSTVLDANPNWFNSVSGRIYGRLKIDSPAAVQVFKTWAQTQYNPANDFNTIGTDPEDGRGGSDDPLPANGFDGINIWNHADKWWWLANETAKLYDENNAKVQITAYAYGDGPYNALVPKFTLRKNVYPIIIPYAFQTAYLPKQMVRLWANAITGRMGIYDYWNITQYSFGVPQFNIYEMPAKLNFWKQNKVDGMNIETTDAGGPMGHAWWIGSQLEFDKNKNIDTLLNQYVKDCFGAAATPMKKMYNRWSLNYQNSAEVNFSLRDLKNATDTVAVNSPEWKRINDLKAYVHFMKLMAQRTYTQPNNDSIYQYMYSIHQRMLVQTVAFTGQQYFGVAPAPLTDHQLTEAEIETNFATDLAALPVEYEISNMVFDYDKATYIDSIPIGSWKYGLFASGDFKAQFTGVVSVDMGTIYGSQAKIYTDDSVYVNEALSSSNFTFNEIIDGRTWYMKNYKINVIAGQTYNVGSSPSGFSRVRMRTPNIILFLRNTADNFDNADFPLKYFYVPIGTTKIAYRDVEPQPMNTAGYLIPPGGVGLIRTKTSAANIYTVNVPTGMDGRVWKASFGHSGWSFVNIPNISTLQNFSYNEFP